MSGGVGEAVAALAARLAKAGIDNARLDARLLAAAVLGGEPMSVFSHPERSLTPEQVASLEALAGRRAAREPMSHILGLREFWGMPFRVSADTLTPRPDSETLIEAALKRLDGRRTEPLRLLDLGTGTGCLLLALLSELPAATGLGVDASPEALAVARGNALNLGLADRASFVQGNWGQGLAGPFDLALSNPPYIPTADIAGLMPEVRDHEPRLALDGGADGFESLRRLLPDLHRLLAPGGAAFLEIGHGQAEETAALAIESGMQLIEIKDDLAGIPRCLAIRRPAG